MIDKSAGEKDKLVMQQRHLIALLAVNSVACSLILVPSMFFLGRVQDVSRLKSISLNNVDADEASIWIPVAVAFAQLPLTLFVMRRYALQVKSTIFTSSIFGINTKGDFM